MVNGVPTLMFYDMTNKAFAPTMSVSTGSIDIVEKFLASWLQNCKLYFIKKLYDNVL